MPVSLTIKGRQSHFVRAEQGSITSRPRLEVTVGRQASHGQWVAYTPNHANISVTDHAGIGERSATRLRFLRTITNGNGYQHCAPGARVRFATDSSTLRLNLYWNALVTRLDTFESTVSILVNGDEFLSFDCPYAANVDGFHQPEFSLPSGLNEIDIVWPYAAGLDLMSIEVDSGARFDSASARPTSKLAVAGDSITHGFSVDRTVNSYAYKLAALQGRQLVNIANGSETAVAANGNALDGLACDKVLYFIGFNNFYPQSSVSAFQAQVEGWIANARAKLPGAAIHVGMHRTLKTAANYGGTIEPATYRAAVQAAEAAAGDANTFYIDGLSLVSADTANFSDGIHFSNAGADAVATALNSLI